MPENEKDEKKKDLINTKVISAASFAVIVALLVSVNKPEIIPGGPVTVILGAFLLVFIGIAWATFKGMDEKQGK